MNYKIKFFTYVILSIPLLFSCKKDEEPVKKKSSSGKVIQDSIKAVIPTKAFPGLEVTIVGEAFNTTNIDSNKAFFNGVEAQTVRATKDSLTVIVPVDSKPGFITVKVNGFQRANTLAFSHFIFPKPAISNICNKGDRALKIADFEIYKIERCASPYKCYEFFHRFIITNTGTKEADLKKYGLQNFISDDTKVGGDTGAGGRTISGVPLSSGESLTIKYSGNSSVMKDGINIDGKYLLLEVQYDNENCTDLITQKIVLK